MTKAPSGRPTKAQRDETKAAQQKAKAEEKARKDEIKRLAREEGKKSAPERSTGDNAKNMNNAERQELFLKHADHWGRIEKEVRAWIKKREDIEKLAKEDGFTKKALVASAKIDDPRKHAKLVAEMRMIAQVAIWKGAPLNFQMDMFGKPEPKSEVQVTDQAYAEGRNTSATGQPRRVPVQYPPPGESFNAWLSGFDDHQKELQGTLGRGTASADDDHDVRPTALREKEAERAAEGAKPAPTSGVPTTRAEYEASKKGGGGKLGLEGLGAATNKIIQDAGGKPSSSSSGLASDQGIPEE